MKTVSQEGHYFVNFSEYMGSRVLRALCNCCCKSKQCYKERMQRLKRHKIAQERLISEVDLVSVMQMKRTAEFMAKLSLKRYQRALVSRFRKYQLDYLGKMKFSGRSERNDSVDEEVQVLSTDIQRRASTILGQAVDLLKSREVLSHAQEMLLQDIQENFDAEENNADMAILYEVTGYQDSKKRQFFKDFDY